MDIKAMILKMRRAENRFDDVPDLDKRIECASNELTTEIWDRKSAINGVKAEDILKRNDIPEGGAIYLVKDSSGRVIIFQPHEPKTAGFVPMDEKTAIGYAENHKAEMVASAVHSQLLAEEIPVLSELEQARADKIDEIQRASNAMFQKMQGGYTQGEVSSFERQKCGARDILAGKLETEDALYVASLAQIRQAGGDQSMTPLILAQKIAANATAAEQATVMILGKQQGLEVKAREAKTLEELEAILW